MNETRARQLIDAEKAGGKEYLKIKKDHLNILDIYLNQCLSYYDDAKTDEDRDKVFKTYVITNKEIPKDDQRNLLRYGVERERDKFKIMSLYEQGKYIQEDLTRYRRRFAFNLSDEIQMIDIDKFIPSKHLMN